MLKEVADYFSLREAFDQDLHNSVSLQCLQSSCSVEAISGPLFALFLTQWPQNQGFTTVLVRATTCLCRCGEMGVEVTKEGRARSMPNNGLWGDQNYKVPLRNYLILFANHFILTTGAVSDLK